jgi:hypothetical protein
MAITRKVEIINVIFMIVSFKSSHLFLLGITGDLNEANYHKPIEPVYLYISHGNMAKSGLADAEETYLFINRKVLTKVDILLQ